MATEEEDNEDQTLAVLSLVISLICTGVYYQEVRDIARAVRLTFGIRRKLTAFAVFAFLDYSLVRGSEVHSRFYDHLPEAHDYVMKVRPATKIALMKLHPELEAKVFSSASIARLKNLNRRTVDVLAYKLYFYYSYSYELTNNLAEIRRDLLAMHRTATLQRDELGQEILLNLLLRNYLHYNLYNQAEKLSKAQRIEARSNQQFCRYLFYLGKIQTIKLAYTDAKENLLLASRNASARARGFRIQCNKWAILVHLLLGEIPERTTFMQKGMERELRPYFELTNAVRICDLELFRIVAEKFAGTFITDKTCNLIIRLRHNVIRIGLQNISISYSRISLADIAKKLRWNSDNPAADVESIAAKAIRDGAIDATLDHANGWMVSKKTGDIYSTNELQIAFTSRIAFCLNLHNEAVRAMRFPPYM